MIVAALAGLVLMLTAGCAAQPSVPQAPGSRSVGPVILLTAPPVERGTYLGSSACRTCHPLAYERWSATAHAAEFTGLHAGERQRSECLRCHVTGYGARSGFRPGRTDDLAVVGCEACHGPGSDHARGARPDLVPTATGGECPPCEANRICRLCHTQERSPGFDLERDLSRVICPRAVGR